MRSLNRNSMAIFRYCASFSELVVTLIPSCTGVVQAGSSRPTPETSTIQSRHAPTDEMPASQQSVGMYLPPARAPSRMVCPSWAGTYSPSIRIEMFSGMEFLLVMVLDIAPQTSRGFIQSFFGAERDHGLYEALHALPRRQLFQVVPLAGAGFPRRRVAVHEAGVDFVPAIRAHQTLVHLPRGLLPVAHGVAHVARATDQVAARVELAAAGFERVAVHFQRAVLQIGRAHV